MSFAADLKDFASNFRDTYKTLHESGRDELAREQAGYMREQRDAAARGEATFQANRVTEPVALPDARSSTAPRAPSMATPDAIGAYSTAIQNNESSGNPQAKGPIIASGAYAGDRAYGLHQVMGKNIPVWTKEVLGRAYTPEEYVADVPAQHKVFNAKFGQLVQKYGNPEDAASAWFTGLPYAQAVARGRGDQLGTRVQDYVRKFKAGLGRRAALDTEDDETVPVVYAATGGVIPSGLGRALDTTENESAGSNPVTRDVMDAERSDLEDWNPRSLVDIEGARTAVAGGLKFGQRLLGLETHHAAVPDAAPLNPDGVTALQTNAGAPPREQIDVIHKTVDPKGELPPELRDIAGYNALQKFWTARGEPQKADAAAWNMLQAGKKAVSQYGAMALSVDDPVKRAQLIARAHNEFLPDGEVMKITGKSGNGAKFELFDNKGDLTEKGVLAMDDMVKMATGMHNGTAYLQSMVKFATAAPSAKDKALEARRGALADFDAASPEDDIVMSRLSDKQREAMTRMDPQDRRAVLTQERQKMDIERKQSNFDTRLQVGAENMDRKEAIDLAKTAIRLGQWETTRDQVMTMHEQKLAQLQAQEAGRNNRFDQSMEARLKRQREIDQRILDKRTSTRDGAGQKLTAKQKDAAAVEDKRLAGEQAITSRSDVPEGTDVEGGPWTGPALAEERLGTARAQTGYAAAREQQAKLEGKSGVDPDATATAVTELWTKPKAEGGFEQKTPLTPKQRDTFTGLATGIASANHIPAEQAIRVAIDAANPRVPVRFRQDPTDPRAATVQLGGHPPMRIGADTLNLIAMARGGELNPRQAVPDRTYRGSDYRTNPPPRATTALPGVTGNPLQARRKALDLDMLESGQLNPMYRP